MRLPVTQRQGECAIALALACLALVLLSEVPGMPGGAPDEPGPAALPIAVAALLLLTAGGMVLRALLTRPDPAEVPAEFAHGRVGVALAGLVLIALLFDHLGALLTMVVFLVLALRAYAGLSWARTLLGACIGALVAFGFFDTLLGVRLPRGVLAGLL